MEKEEVTEGKYILRADERLAKEVGESRNQIGRYINSYLGFATEEAFRDMETAYKDVEDRVLEVLEKVA